MRARQPDNKPLQQKLIMPTGLSFFLLNLLVVESKGPLAYPLKRLIL